MKRGRGNRKTRAAIEERRSREVELMKDGKTRGEVAAEVGVSRMTLWRDLKALDARFGAENSELLRELKAKVGEALLKAADEVWAGGVPADVANSWRSILADFSKLLGLNAESRSVVAHVSTADSAPYMRFKKACSGLREEQLEDVLRYAAALPRREPERDESWLPRQAPKEIAR